MPKIILASSSPRRKQLLEKIGLDFDVVVSGADEIVNENLSAIKVVEKLAYKKAYWVAEKYPSKLVIGADTVVIRNNQIMGKPRDKDEAFQMLSSLNGTKHQVVTGVALIQLDRGKYLIDHRVTDVYFKNNSESDLWGYIATGEPFDKAGAYGIQGIGSCLVEKIYGCYFNVVGLPISLVVDMLREFGIHIFGGYHE